MQIPKSVAEVKRLPIGTKLVLVCNARGPCEKRRVIHGVIERGKTMTLRTPENEMSFLPLTGEFFSTEATFGFKADGGIAAEYRFDVED